MNQNECADSLKRCFGGFWLTLLDGDEFLAINLCIISSMSVRIGCSIRLKPNGQLSIEINQQLLPSGHLLYADMKGSTASWDRVFNVAKTIWSAYYVCSGIDFDGARNLFESIGRPLNLDIISRDWPSVSDQNAKQLQSNSCSILVRRAKFGCSLSACHQCRRSSTLLSKYSEPAKSQVKTSVHASVPDLLRSIEEKSAKIRELSMKVHRFEERLEKIRSSQLRPASIRCLEILENDVNSLSPSIHSPVAEFLQQQFKALNMSNNRCMVWDRRLIEWAIMLHSRSAAAYEFIVESNLFRLPSSRTLSRYVTKFPKCSGLNDEIIKNFVDEYCSTFTQPYAKYIAMSLDEMKIRANLVYNKRNNELVGFVESSEMMNAVDDRSFGDADRIATDVLVIYVRGIGTGFERAVAWFPVRRLCGGEIMSIVWTVKRKLEFFSIQGGTNRIRIVTVTCDGLAANHLFFKLHAESDADSIPYKAKDPFDPSTDVYFMVDPPHLVKTIRNNFEKSSTREGAVKNLHFNQPILWDHVERIYQEDAKNTWRRLPKLTPRHIFLTSSDRMKVKLAAQVLSRSVSLAMSEQSEMEDSSRLCEIANRFFDILNGRHPNEAHERLNDDLAPFTSPDDFRLHWLKNECLTFFNEWESAVDSMDLPKSEKQRRLLSRQTVQGIRITINGFVEVIQWLLSQPDAPPYILSGIFNQDKLEIYFGHVRTAGGSNDHPDWNQFQRIASILNQIKTWSCRMNPVRGSNIS